MSYKIIPTDNFVKEAKKLSKKYRSLYKDLELLELELKINPREGTHIAKDVYKIRIAIKSKGKGKSGGARVISYVYICDKQIFLMSVYDKSQKENISDKEIKKLLKEIGKL